MIEDSFDPMPLYRQRRFLVLMCLAIIAYYLLGADVRDSAEYSGFVVTLSHPERVAIGLWLAWGWALLRYWQRFYELMSRLWSEVRADVDAEDRRLLLRWGLREARRLAKAGDFDERHKHDVTISRVIWHYEFAVDGQKNIPPIMPAKGGGRRVGMYVAYNWLSPENEFGSTGQPFTPTMSAGTTRWHRTKAWTCALFALPAFSEHFVPLLLAAMTPVVALISVCTGD